ncbi:MAG: helix-turn-helix transcriptional regulator [Candidatus Aminicenantes bacterium]|nr:helix-turn-helix transcriptional regulator [Candidatus Aminicenantes bacterium]
METIGRREEQILLAVGSLGEEAYLVSIKKFLSQIQGKTLSIGAVHIPLRRLERSGLISSCFGDSSPVRGGRRKKIYSLTEKAVKILEENKRVHDLLWAKYDNIES